MWPTVTPGPGKLAWSGWPGDPASDEGIHHPDPGDKALRHSPPSLSTFSRHVSSASMTLSLLTSSLLVSEIMVYPTLLASLGSLASSPRLV